MGLVGTKMTAYDVVCRERRHMSLLLCWHSVTFILFLLNIFYVAKFMAMPDRVIVMGRDNSLYRGKSCDVGGSVVFYDVACKAVDVFLRRNYMSETKERTLAFVYSDRALSSVKARISEDSRMFLDRHLSQEPQITLFKFKDGVMGPVVLVEGFLHRNGKYFGHQYYQKLGFALKMSLKRSEEAKRLPFVVERARYWEWEIKEGEK